MKTIKTAKLRTTFQPEIKQTVTAIIDDVRERGDQAVFEWSQKFDHSNRSIFRVSETEIKEALASVDDTTLDAIKAALNNIKAFAHAQRKSLGEISAFSPMPGLTLGHKLVPVDAVCCYVPGGSYPLFSSALMLITPAKAAGVKRIAACSPVEKGTGSINKTTLAAMSLAGADEIYAAGGVQAIAAFAWGTSQIKPVDLITGPGNAYVAEAKRQCYGQCGIDFIAGPSEVLIIADNSACAETIACDLLAQCEHDKLAQGILVTTSEKLAAEVIAALETQLETLATAETARAAWEDYGEIHLAGNLDEALEFANERAAEHVELQTKENDRLAGKLRNFGALFIGEESAEVFGDYAAGTNHTLPTLRAARWTGGLWVGTFLKTLTFQKATPEAAAKLAPLAAQLAVREGLAAHSRAAEKRQRSHA